MSTAGTSVEKHLVDQAPPLSRLIPLGLQHVLAMYAGAVAVPLVVGGALVKAGKLESGDLAYLISADVGGGRHRHPDPVHRVLALRGPATADAGLHLRRGSRR